ncbi:hypothetical protein Snoj_29930 [Streptomyces nojiriensis]|uniref:Uncharacterized protein n=1 Tax=Streptomyces nojiriensis TaxID=66374 RepID=A0ABQ3SML4_9ACTN|nr:hypothetical protein GCM10010205_52110 [Streptomyces nojiriensis]GHI69075.1 hypothetical protein Snoj_29930 [Streptomyces nojiriensis]
MPCPAAARPPAGAADQIMAKLPIPNSTQALRAPALPKNPQTRPISPVSCQNAYRAAGGATDKCAAWAVRKSPDGAVDRAP